MSLAVNRQVLTRSYIAHIKTLDITLQSVDDATKRQITDKHNVLRSNPKGNTISGGMCKVVSGM